MKPAVLFLILSTAVCLAACVQKDDPAPEELTFPIGVKATAVESAGTVRLFTKDGEVTDEAVVAKFISDGGGFNDDFEIEPTDVITFSSEHSASFQYTAMAYQVTVEQGNKLVFSSPFSIDAFGENLNPLLRQFLLDEHRIAKSNILHTVPTATGFTYTGEQRRIADGDYQSFLMPATVYKLSRRVGQGEHGASHQLNSGVFSEFNDAFLETLQARDTIAYQERNVRYKR